MANKPVLFYGLEAMVLAGITDIGIIVAPETGDEIREAAGDGSRFGATITYIDQHAPLGLAHAVLTAEPFLGDDPFVMYLGDNLLQGGIADLVDAFQANGPDALILSRRSDPQNYGVAELQGDRVIRLVEKPRSRRAIWRWSACTCSPRSSTRPPARSSRAREASWRSPTPSSTSSTGGERVEPHIVRGWWKDTGRLEDMLDANRLILDRVEPRIEGELIESQCDGRVIVEAGARLERTTVRGPAIIGAGARLVDAYIGPYTAIGENCVIEASEIEHSILLAGASVRQLAGRMEASLLGRNVRISRGVRQPRAYRFMVGDNSEIGIL